MNQTNIAPRSKIKHCCTKRRTTQRRTQTKKPRKNKLDTCENHLFKLKEMRKIRRCVILCQRMM